MKLQGTRYVVEDFDVPAPVVLEKLREHIFGYRMPGEYINRGGFWEIDHGGHGTGYQEERRKATPEEVKISEAFKTLKNALAYLDSK